MNNKEIIQFLAENDKNYRKQGNIYFAEKAFLVKSVIDSCIQRRKEGTLTDSEASVITSALARYLKDEVIMFWLEDGIVGITEIKKKGGKNE